MPRKQCREGPCYLPLLGAAYSPWSSSSVVASGTLIIALRNVHMKSVLALNMMQALRRQPSFWVCARVRNGAPTAHPGFPKDRHSNSVLTGRTSDTGSWMIPVRLSNVSPAPAARESAECPAATATRETVPTRRAQLRHLNSFGVPGPMVSSLSHAQFCGIPIRRLLSTVPSGTTGAAAVASEGADGQLGELSGRTPEESNEGQPVPTEPNESQSLPTEPNEGPLVRVDLSRIPGTENAKDGLMTLVFTCCKCNRRSAKKFSKVWYCSACP